MAKDDEMPCPDERTPVPRPAAVLGGLGLLPFLAASGFAHAAEGELVFWAQTLLAAYGACILSFLGGIHWGLAIAPGAAASGWWRRERLVAPRHERPPGPARLAGARLPADPGCPDRARRGLRDRPRAR